MSEPTDDERVAIKEAERLAKSGDIAGAEALFDKRLRDSGAPLVHWVFGSQYLNQDRFNDAVICFQRATELDNQCVPAWGGLGRALLSAERWEEAETALRRRLELGESANHYVFLAMALSRQSRFEEAARCCERAIQLDGRNVDAFVNMGFAYSMLGLHDDAIACCRSAVMIDENYDESHLCMGVVLCQAGMHSEASDAIQRAIDISPERADAYYELGLIHRLRGDRLLAKAYLQAASSLENTNGAGESVTEPRPL